MNSTMTSFDAMLPLLKAAGIDVPDSGRVTFTGREPVYRSDFPLATAGAAALGAVGVAADTLWRNRHGGEQKIEVDVRHAGASLRSANLLRIDGDPARDTDPLRGFYKTADGRHIYIHTQFPHFKRGMCKLLGCEPEPESVARAFSKWQAQEFEDAAAEAGLCAVIVRPRDEWLAHPQGKAVAALPVIAIEKIGDSDPEPLPDTGGLLEGIRVLDLTRVIAGPTSGRTLTLFGAQVMRISAPHLHFVPGLVVDTGFGKRAAEIDLRNENDRETFDRLVRTTDVFTQSYRPQTLARRGYSPERLAEIRPGIVHASLCAWSHAGPWQERRGYDSIVTCATGMAHRQGTDDQPGKIPCQPLDYISGYLCALGIFSALQRRAVEGGSYAVRVSLAQTAEWIWSLGLIDGSAGINPEPENLQDLIDQCDSAFGSLAYLRSPLTMTDTAPAWRTPPVPLGTHAPEWVPPENRE